MKNPVRNFQLSKLKVDDDDGEIRMVFMLIVITNLQLMPYFR